MNIAVVCNSDVLAFPSIKFLIDNGHLAGVGILEKNIKILKQPLISLGVAESTIGFFEKKNWIAQQKEWLAAIKPDAVWVFGFPWAFPNEILAMPPKGFCNFHFGLLPKYKGADPIFWQIKNGEKNGGVVIHKITEQVDEGPVVWKEEVPIIPGENYGLHTQRMGLVVVNILNNLLNEEVLKKAQKQEESTETVSFFKKPDTNQLTINWDEQSADEIESLVNASNPKYDGASTKLRGMEVRLLEITPADVNNPPEVKPGTVIHADALYGLIVACRDKKFIRLNILSTREGYMSGVKLFALGIKAGDLFHH
ncbi:MAG: formyltransferase family protein [Bacteroidota bacterium]